MKLIEIGNTKAQFSKIKVVQRSVEAIAGHVVLALSFSFLCGHATTPLFETLEICDKHKCKDARIKQKMRSIDKHNYGTTRNTINKNSRDLILKLFLTLNLDLCQKILDSSEFSFCYLHDKTRHSHNLA